MSLATCGVLPPVSSQYDLVWTLLMPLAVALTLLGVNVRDAASKAGPVLRAFVVGAVGSVLGAVVAFAVVGAGMGEHAWRLASCLCASYVGGFAELRGDRAGVRAERERRGAGRARRGDGCG